MTPRLCGSLLERHTEKATKQSPVTFHQEATFQSVGDPAVAAGLPSPPQDTRLDPAFNSHGPSHFLGPAHYLPEAILLLASSDVMSQPLA
ncbi:hypothetical protein ElyMa_003849000 [Elysia marginata]|uniref:CTNNB1 binding N-teminal domain-containing protein n=1 Tax=Elysia marginata TaxID=1093978 RepID=A0AAV4FJ04_9GAST|nr:hypothetical protein ElyMa_003849000 [Elysia marginata]